jgi:hypothetical protein
MAAQNQDSVAEGETTGSPGAKICNLGLGAPQEQV